MAELPVVPQRQRFENPLPRDGQEHQESAWFPVKWEEGRAGASAVGCGGQECAEQSEEPLDRPAGKGVRWHGGMESKVGRAGRGASGGQTRAGGLREGGTWGWLATTLYTFPADSKASFLPTHRIFCFP